MVAIDVWCSQRVYRGWSTSFKRRKKCFRCYQQGSTDGQPELWAGATCIIGSLARAVGSGHVDWDDEWQAGLVDKRPSPDRLNTTLGGWQAPLTLPRSGVRPRGFCTQTWSRLAEQQKSAHRRENEYSGRSTVKSKIAANNFCTTESMELGSIGCCVPRRL